MKILLATNNRDKRREISGVLSSDRIELVFPESLAKTPPFVVEDGFSYEENSLKKARAFSLWAGMSALADDTGLEISSLSGEPGVFSARYAGEKASYEDNVRLLLENLKDQSDRKAKFVCVICLYTFLKESFFFRGEIEGSISFLPSGNKGFGYDPVFVPDGHGVSFAEMPEELKNKISHRAKALEAFSRWLKSVDLRILGV